MNQASPPTHTAPRWRRWLQFRLLTLLLFTAAVGAGLAGYQYYRERPPVVEEIPGGMRLQRPALRLDEPSAVRRPWLVVRDKSGRVLCQGVYVNGVAGGTWTYYHENGRAALSGRCRASCRDGVWVAWNEQGRRTAEIGHKESRGATVANGWGAPAESPWNIPRKPRLWSPGTSGGARVSSREIPSRSGVACQWWDNGHLRSAGEFLNDQPHGPWSYGDDTGERLLQGEYDRGRRVGVWCGGTATPGNPPTIGYVSGLQVASVDDWFAQCHEALASDDWRRRQDAADALKFAGPQALPHWIQALRRAHRDVLLFALKVLAKAGGKARDAVPEIDRLTSSTDLTVANEARLTAFAVDESHRGERFAQLLRFLLAHLDAHHVHLLQRMSTLHSTALSLLEQTLESDDAERRLLAVVIVGEMFAASRTPQSADDTLADALSEVLQKAAWHTDPRVAAHAKAVLPPPPPAASGNGGMGGMGTGGMF